MNCPQCKTEMKPIVYDSGFDVLVKSNTCPHCHFNVTDTGHLERQLSKLRENMQKEVKIISIGDGVGIRFPQQVVDFLKIKKGKKAKVSVGAKKIEISL